MNQLQLRSTSGERNIKSMREKPGHGKKLDFC